MNYVPKSLGEEADISTGDQSLGYHTKTFLIFGVLFVVGVLFVAMLSEFTAGFIPDKWEVKVFASDKSDETNGDKEVDKKNQEIDGVFGSAVVACQQFPSYAGFENKVGFTKLLKEAKRKLNFKINCIDEDTPNAFAYPGGGVYLTSELLKHVKTPVGLAFVIGHELGHHENRHVLKRLGRVISFQTVLSVFGMSDMQGIKVFSDLGELSFSRHDELQADDFGISVVSKYFSDFNGVTEFFEYVSSLEQSAISDSSLGNVFSTHPVNSERIRRIQEKLGIISL